MQLWHKELISVLPDDILQSQWRELYQMAVGHYREWRKFGMNNGKLQFIVYTKLVLNELKKRNLGIKRETFDSYLKNIKVYKSKYEYANLDFDAFYQWQDDVYFKRNYYKLKTMYEDNKISSADWLKIQEKFCKKFEKQC